MTNYYFSLIPTVCISMIAATRRIIRALNTPKQAKHVENKKWKTKKIEVNKEPEKKEA